MKKIIGLFMLLFLCFKIFAQEAVKEEKKVIPLPYDESKTEIKSLIVIDPKNKALDFVSGFEYLKKEKPSSKIFFRLENGQMIANIVEVSAMENGTLVLFKLSTSQGIKLLFVRTEDIKELGHL